MITKSESEKEIAISIISKNISESDVLLNNNIKNFMKKILNKKIDTFAIHGSSKNILKYVENLINN